VLAPAALFAAVAAAAAQLALALFAAASQLDLALFAAAAQLVQKTTSIFWPVRLLTLIKAVCSKPSLHTSSPPPLFFVARFHATKYYQTLKERASLKRVGYSLIT
jgi:hypothetical protein